MESKLFIRRTWRQGERKKEDMKAKLNMNCTMICGRNERHGISIGHVFEIK